MRSSERDLLVAWAFLAAATLSSFWISGHLDARVLAPVATLTLAAAKVGVVLRSFMRADRLATPMKLFFLVWTIGCAGLISVGAIVTTTG